jgi:threonine dehydrogenase-like Zn-dependent dehydrogenase
MSSNIPLKMKAAIQYGPKQVGIEMVDVPQIKDDEVLIRVKNIGTCPSDVRSYVAADKRQWYQYGTEGYGLSGYEWSGEVIKIGKDVNEIKLYDKVVPEIIIPCGTCKYCRQGYTNLCIHKSYISRGYAEYAVAPSKYLYTLPPNVSFSEAAFTEPLAVVTPYKRCCCLKARKNCTDCRCRPNGIVTSYDFKAIRSKYNYE